jgi:hypothetical protein
MRSTAPRSSTIAIDSIPTSFAGACVASARSPSTWSRSALPAARLLVLSAGSARGRQAVIASASIQPRPASSACPGIRVTSASPARSRASRGRPAGHTEGGTESMATEIDALRARVAALAGVCAEAYQLARRGRRARAGARPAPGRGRRQAAPACHLPAHHARRLRRDRGRPGPAATGLRRRGAAGPRGRRPGAAASGGRRQGSGGSAQRPPGGRPRLVGAHRQ